MKAAVFHKPKDISVDNVADPVLQHPRDAIIRVTSTAICGSDLHIYNGMFPQVRDLVMGHEFMGIVEEVGREAGGLQKGDRVIVPFAISCGQCWFCNHHMPTHCEESNTKNYGPQGHVLEGKGGGLFGYTDLYGGYDGGQAEYVRIPYADRGPRRVPDHMSDNEILFTTDIFPTGYAAVDWCALKGGETVAVFGCGPVGIMAQKSAWLKGAGRVIGIDIQPYRLEKARASAGSEVINAAETDVIEALREMTGGRGPDACIDAVGLEADRNFMDRVAAVLHVEKGTMKVLKYCLEAVRRGGVVSVVGVYGTDFDNFPLGQFFDKGLIMRAGQCPVHNYVDECMALAASGRVKLDDIITHELPLSQAAHAYDIFNNKKEDCVKVVLKPGS